MWNIPDKMAKEWQFKNGWTTLTMFPGGSSGAVKDWLRWIVTRVGHAPIYEIYIRIHIRIFAHMRIIRMNRIFRIRMANPSLYTLYLTSLFPSPDNNILLRVPKNIENKIILETLAKKLNQIWEKFCNA